jgi:hypothetical protein
VVDVLIRQDAVQNETVDVGENEVPRIEITLGSIPGASSEAPYVAVAVLHLLDGEMLYQPLTPTPAQDPLPHLDKQAAANLLAEIYDFVCQRWGAAPPKE